MVEISSATQNPVCTAMKIGECRGDFSQDGMGLLNHLAVSSNQCTLYYRCVNKCPRQAITLLGRKVTKQGCIEIYS